MPASNAQGILDSAARQILKLIVQYLVQVQKSPVAARRVAKKFAAKATSQAARPLLGLPRPDLADSVRCFVVYRYVAFYRLVDGGIQVLRVIHGSRDILREFQGQDPEQE